MSANGPAGERRRRLLAKLQGRSLAEALGDPGLWAEVEAEARSPDADSLLSPAVLAHLRELADARMATPAIAPEMFDSTDAVVIVPGFLASGLRDESPRGLGTVWLGPATARHMGALELAPFDGREADLDPALKIGTDGALPILYDILRLALEVRRYTTEIHAVDWRKDLDLAARGLAGRLRSLGQGARPVHLVAHSQGAIVARRALQHLGAIEARRVVRHLVLLGPAHHGSFSAVFALAGDCGMIELARKFVVETPRGFRRVLGSMSGLYQLLPWDEARVPWLRDNDLSVPSFWRRGIDAARLVRFHGWTRGLQTEFFDDRTTVILGDNHGRPTVGGVAYRGDDLSDAPEHALPGDGTVPHSCAVLPGVPAYLARGVEHSVMATDRRVIGAVLDVLSGRTPALLRVSSDPDDHLETPSGVEFTPPLNEPPARPPDLNGAFLPATDGVDKPAAPAYRRRRGAGDEPPITDVTLQAGAHQEAYKSDLEIILDRSNLLPFAFLRDGDRLGRAVVKVHRADGAAGTGFLVAPGILLTNHHVLPDATVAATARAHANHEADPEPAYPPIVVPLDPAALFVSNAELDFTFVAVAGLDSLGCVPPSRDSLGIARSEYVNIIQHPRGRPKEVALQDNQVEQADHVVVRYSCDTEPGSSGSPVFDNRWKLVALHHASVVTDGPGGRSAPSGASGSKYLNEGIRLSAIALWLETADANPPEVMDQAARVRSIFGDLDPLIGYFGALGERSGGRSAVEVVVQCYDRAGDHLDLGWWDLRDIGPGRIFGERVAEVGWAIADMGLDLWCLELGGPEAARALCNHLETNFQLDYALLLPEAGGPSVIYRRSRNLAVGRGEGSAIGARVLTRRGATVPIAVLPMPARALGGPPRSIPAAAVDAVLIGVGADLGPADLSALAGARFEARAATVGDGAAIIVLCGADSRVERIYVSPGQSPSGEALVADDRPLPASLRALGTSRPIAVRLALGDPRPAGAFRPLAAPALPAEVAPPPAVAARQPLSEDDLERRLRELLGPLVARIIAEARGA